MRKTHKPATGPLRVHPHNPRYFTDGTGKAVYLTGSHTWNSLEDGAFFTAENADPPPAFDFTAYLDFLQRHNHNFIRLWRFELPKFYYWLDTDNSRLRGPNSRMGFQHSQPHPWARTGPGAALDGKPKFDLSRFDPAYFDRLRSRVLAARDRGFYVSVMLFEGGMVRGRDEKQWGMHPFNVHNNINGIDGDVNRDGVGPKVHSLLIPGITDLQKVYIRRAVDTVNDLDNVLYEVGNEFAFSEANTQWQYWVVNYVKEYEATRPNRHPVGMVSQMHHPWKDGIPDDPRNAVLFNGPADWVSPGNRGGNGYDDKTSPPAADGRKVILLDTDHLWGCGCDDPAWVWKSFVRGHNPLFMDMLPEITEHTLRHERAVEVRAAMGHTRSYAERMDLAAMTPRDDLASTQYCLANPGREYLVYLPEGGETTVELSQGTGFFAVEWFNPRTGTASNGGPVEAGAKRFLKAPFEGDAVLYLVEKKRDRP